MTPVGEHPYLCGGVRIDSLDLQSAVARVVKLATAERGSAIHLCNSYTIALASRDGEYLTTVNRGDLNLADGTPVVWVGRLLRIRSLHGPVRGATLFREVVDRGRAHGLRHYLYGGTPATVEALAEVLQRTYPGIDLRGAESPPFGKRSSADDVAAGRRIQESGANVVWVGLGTPQQDHFVARASGHADAAFVAVGAAFDFISGSKPEAPGWLHGTGLEWVHRLVSEPRRLGARYAIGNLQFLVAALRGPTRRLS